MTSDLREQAQGLWQHDKEAQEQFEEAKAGPAGVLLKCSQIKKGTSIRIRLLDDSFTKRVTFWLPKEKMGTKNNVRLIFRPSIEREVMQLLFSDGTPLTTAINERSKPRASWRIPIIHWTPGPKDANGKSGPPVATAKCLDMPFTVWTGLAGRIDGSANTEFDAELEPQLVYRSPEDPGRDLSVRSIDRGDQPQSYDTDRCERSITMTEAHLEVFAAAKDSIKESWFEEMSINDIKQRLGGAESATDVSEAVASDMFDVAATPGAQVEVPAAGTDDYDPFTSQ